MELIIVAFGLAAVGLIPGAIAWSRGRSFFSWWLYGALLFVIATPHAILLTPDRRELDQRRAREGYGRCPSCAEMVRKEARRCPHCHDMLVEPA